jgi:hypothetical protein
VNCSAGTCVRVVRANDATLSRNIVGRTLDALTTLDVSAVDDVVVVVGVVVVVVVVVVCPAKQ